MSHKGTKPQPYPRKNKAEPYVLPLVLTDLSARAIDGAEKYGTFLQPHNERDALVDAYQEALDLCMYLRQTLYERDGE